MARYSQRTVLLAMGAGTCLWLLSLALTTDQGDWPHPWPSKVMEPVVATIFIQNETLKGTGSSACSPSQVVLSSTLDHRELWKRDPNCSEFTIRHMVPGCRAPVALASFPGSGNTWLRQMLEAAGGIFTGSIYKDMQIQMFGLWGELRNWQDGTTVVQKTHDASFNHVVKDFGGRAVLILRNPYEAILSLHNYLYGGHHGLASAKDFKRTDWEQFVTVQASKWLDIATNWTIHSNPSKVILVHYELLKKDMMGQLRRILTALGLPANQDRFKCSSLHRFELFRRGGKTKMVIKKLQDQDTLPFRKNVREQMDAMIDHVNSKVLIPRGYEPMPLHLYKFYRKTDESIREALKQSIKTISSSKPETDGSASVEQEDKLHGTRMLIDKYIKWVTMDSKNGPMSTKKIGELLDGLGGVRSAHKVISTIVELWPAISTGLIANDPIAKTIENDGYRGKQISDLVLPE